MTESVSLGERIAEMLKALLAAGMTYLPSIVGAVLLLMLGWVLARVLQTVAQRTVSLAESGLSRVLGEGRAARLRLARSANVLGAIVFWAVMLFFVTAATQVLGLATFTQWLARLLEYLPTLVAGLLIVIAGYLLSRFVADLILTTAGRLAPAQRTVVARAAQLTILIGAILVGADQIGIKVTFLAIFAAATLLAIAGGVVVATSLGARTHVANLIGAHQSRQSFAVGQTIRVAGHEGRILEMTPHSVVLETDDGRLTIPGRVFSEDAVLLVARGSGGD
jgi:hypothetical protein